MAEMLRLLVNERLTAAAEEIFGLVEKTIAEYQSEVVRSKEEIIQLKKQLEQLTVLTPEVVLFRAGKVKVEQFPVLVEKEIQEHPQIKEGQVDQCISPDMEANTFYSTEVKSEPATGYEPLSSSAAVTVSVNESMEEEWNEDDASSSPPQNDSVDVFVELEQPLREEKLCRFCGKRFKKDSHLISHVDKSHKGHKAFKCLECDKEFEQRYQLVLHIRIHTGEKPFSCDFCGKTFVQNSNRIVHMRQHTGEKPYFCKKCRKRFANSHHLKRCRGKQNKSTNKSFRCMTCGRTFHTDSDLKVHTEVHESWKRHISRKLED